VKVFGIGKDIGADNPFEPTFGFSEFFKSDPQLMNKISSRLGTLRFSVMGQRCRSRSEKLITDMPFRIVRI